MDTARSTHHTRKRARFRAAHLFDCLLVFGVIITNSLLAACALADVGQPGASLPDGTFIRKAGFGNQWQDEAGQRYTGLQDLNGNTYFLNAAGETICCYSMEGNQLVYDSELTLAPAAGPEAAPDQQAPIRAILAGGETLLRLGLGNVWINFTGQHFNEMLDGNGSVYFLDAEGNRWCCYVEEEGVLVERQDLSFLTPYKQTGVDMPVRVYGPAGGGTLDVAIGETGEMVADLGFRPDKDGFSFANFGADIPQSVLTVDELRRLFGTMGVCADVSGERCIPFPAAEMWMNLVNDSMTAGHCEGLASLSLQLHQGLGSADSYDVAAGTTYDLTTTTEPLMRDIAYQFSLQFLEPVASAYREYQALPPSAILQTLMDSFQGGSGDTYTLGIYSEMGGHAVTPFAVEDVGDGVFWVWVYDNNWPGAPRYIAFDVVDEVWAYSFAATNPREDSSPWFGTTGSLDLTPLSVRERKMECPFCAVTTLAGAESSGSLNARSMGQKTAATQAFVASSQAGNASMCITQGDKQLGVCDGESKNEVEGGSYTALKLAVLRQDGAPTGMYRTIGLASVPAGVQVEVAAEVDPIAGLLEEIAAEVAAEAAAAGDTVASEAPTTVDIAIGGFSAGSSVVVETTTEVAPAAGEEAAVEEAGVEKAPTLVVDEAANFSVSADAGADVAVAAGPLKVDMAVTEGQDFSFEVDETGQASIGVADTETGETVFEAEADTSGDMGGAAVVGLSFEQDDAGDFEQSTSSTIVTDEGITNEVEDAAGNTMR
ncbi:MAG TPA: hypothetical protein QF589_08025, partial [Anaerolineales bacterium]|nr:hypothetical protein [Anaerolineales bacterium]